MRLCSNDEPLKTRSWRVPESLAYRLKRFALDRRVSAETVLCEALTKLMDDAEGGGEDV